MIRPLDLGLTFFAGGAAVSSSSILRFLEVLVFPLVAALAVVPMIRCQHEFGNHSRIMKNPSKETARYVCEKQEGL